MAARIIRRKCTGERRIDEIKAGLARNCSDYSYDEYLSSGAFGLAFLLKNNANHKQYVGKATYYVNDKNTQKLAVNEASALKNLKHDNIVQYMDCFEDTVNQYVFIIMELCAGGDLNLVLKDRRTNQLGRFEEDIVWNWSLQMFSGLDYMHSRSPKVLHRDLKPANIFLTEDLKTLKLGDFGLARSLATRDMANTYCGTPQYFSPELLMEGQYNHKADIWAAGCCVYEMIELHPLAVVDREKKTMELHDMPKDYDKQLVSIIQQLVMKNPDDRPEMSTILKKPLISFKNASLYSVMSTLTVDLTPRTDSMTSSQSTRQKNKSMIAKPRTSSHNTLKKSDSTLMNQRKEKTAAVDPNRHLKSLSDNLKQEDAQATLTSLGYKLNNDGQLRATSDGSVYNHARDGKNYEKICSATRSLLLLSLSNDYNMRKLDLPFDCDANTRTSFVYVSPDIFSNKSKVLILIHGSGRVSAGEWSRKLMINESLSSGSQIPWIVEAQNKGYALIIANLNNMYNDTDSDESDDPNNANSEEHLENIWDVVNNHCPARKAAVLAHSYGGSALLNMAVTQEEFLLYKTFSVVFADSTHEGSVLDISKNLENFFNNHSRNYMPHNTLPLGSPIPDYEDSLSPAYSAGPVEHERTSNTIILEALTFIEGNL